MQHIMQFSRNMRFEVQMWSCWLGVQAWLEPSNLQFKRNVCAHTYRNDMDFRKTYLYSNCVYYSSQLGV
jgi:hypothetical protein